MTTLTIVGIAVGTIIGLVHAFHVYSRRVRECPDQLVEHPVAVRARAVYFALWTLPLWMLLGSYVFYLWVISVAVYGAYTATKTLWYQIAQIAWRQRYGT